MTSELQFPDIGIGAKSARLACGVVLALTLMTEPAAAQRREAKPDEPRTITRERVRPQLDTAETLAAKDRPWRTATWNICQTSPSSPRERPECWAKINPSDAARTASEVERRAIGDRLLEPDFYSFALQEVCERDVRWIAAYVANNGRVPRSGNFGPKQYAMIDSRAPYAFLPYDTADMMDENGNGKADANEDHGCGPGVSTGIAVIVKHVSGGGTPPPKIYGLSNADYTARTGGLRYERLPAARILAPAEQVSPDPCDFYFAVQIGERDDVEYREGAFGPTVCNADYLTTLRGLACVQSSWRASSAAAITRATSCSAHPITGGSTVRRSVRNDQIIAAGDEALAFSEGGPLILSGDFNISIDQQPNLDLLPLELQTGKVTAGPTHRMSENSDGSRIGCFREMDAIFVRGWSFSGARPTDCEELDVAPPGQLRFGFFDDDDKLDVFHRHWSGQWRYSSGGDGQWTPLRKDQDVPGSELRFGDFDGDGITDVFHGRADSEWRYSRNGVDNWTPLGGPWRYAYGGNAGAGRLKALRRLQGVLDLPRELSPVDDACCERLRFGDFDGDGKTDIFIRESDGQWRYSSGGAEGWEDLHKSAIPLRDLRFGDDDGAQVTAVSYVGGARRITGAPDFDGDHARDIFHMNAQGELLYFSSGNAEWAALESDEDVSGAQLRFGDFDGDGKTDLFNRMPDGVWRFLSSDRRRWETIEGSSIPITSLRFGDFDGDGTTDVFWADGFGVWQFSSGGAKGWRRLGSAITPLDPDDPFSWSDHEMLVSPGLTPQ